MQEVPGTYEGGGEMKDWENPEDLELAKIGWTRREDESCWARSDRPLELVELTYKNNYQWIDEETRRHRVFKKLDSLIKFLKNIQEKEAGK